MEKQVLFGINGQNLKNDAHYLMVYFPYDEEMCSYIDSWIEELDDNKYPLVSKGMWSGIINLKTHTLLNWKSEYGNLYFQAKVRDSGTYFLLDKDKRVLCKLCGYVPNGLIPDIDDCGDYIRLKISHNGVIDNWPGTPDFSDFIKEADVVEKIDASIHEEPILDFNVELTYSQLMTKLLRLPKCLQMEIGKALIDNVSEEDDDTEYLVIYKNDLLGYNDCSIDRRYAFEEALKRFNVLKDEFVADCDFFNELRIESDTATWFEATDGEDYVSLRVVKVARTDM